MVFFHNYFILVVDITNLLCYYLVKGDDKVTKSEINIRIRELLIASKSMLLDNEDKIDTLVYYDGGKCDVVCLLEDITDILLY